MNLDRFWDPTTAIYTIAILLAPLLSFCTNVDSIADSGPGSLRALVESAQSGDTIEFESELSGKIIRLESGEISIGENITISAANLSEGIIISGDATGDGPSADDSRIFHIAAGTIVKLHSLTMADGLASVGGNGGGIFNEGTLLLEECNVLRCSAGNGLHGVDGSDGVVNESGIVVEGGDGGDGTDAGHGGAVFNSSTLSATRCRFSGNKAGSGGDGGNGGIAEGNIFDEGGMLIASYFQEGYFGYPGLGGSGGAIYNVGEVVLQECTVEANSSGSNGTLGSGSRDPRGPILLGPPANPGNGGGIYNDHILTIDRTLLRGNQSSYLPENHRLSWQIFGRGHGIDNNGDLIIRNSTLTGNGNESGSAISNAGTTSLEFSSLILNGSESTAFDPVGLGSAPGGVASADPESFVRLHHTVVVEEVALNYRQKCLSAGTLEVSGVNFVTSNATIEEELPEGLPNENGDFSGLAIEGFLGPIHPDSVPPVDPNPMLGPLKDNGGPTLTFLPLPGSPLIDSAGGVAGPSSNTDQRGLPRHSGPTSDIGSVEVTHYSARSTILGEGAEQAAKRTAILRRNRKIEKRVKRAERHGRTAKARKFKRKIRRLRRLLA